MSDSGLREGAKIIEKYASEYPPLLQREPIAPRFQAIHTILTCAFNGATKEKARQETLSLDLREQAELALHNINWSFFHSHAFTDFAQNTVYTFCDYLNNDEPMRETLKDWDKTDLKTRKRAIRPLLGQFIAAASAEANASLSMPELTFSHSKMDKDNYILFGSYTGIIGSKHPNGKISLNASDDAEFDDPREALKTLVHEGIHAVEDQLGLMGLTLPAHVHSFGSDCQLWAAREKYGATIPSDLGDIYKEQYHERLAFQAEEMFAARLITLDIC